MNKYSKLKITIITAVYNGEKYIQETIQSVLNQSYDNIEYIIVDGMSTDKTSQIINSHRQRISRVITQSDNSMYEAINRGFCAATGDYVLVLNSDDQLVSKTTIKEVVNFIADNPGKLAYYGNILKQEGKLLFKRKVFKVDFSHLLYTKHGTLVPHPALFVDRINSLSKIGFYDLSYRYASDFDYILKLLKCGPVVYMNIFVSIFRVHRDSITSSGKIDQERLSILRKYNSAKPYLVKKMYYILIWSRYKILNILLNRA